MIFFTFIEDCTRDKKGVAMPNFFSFLRDKEHNFYYFTQGQRLSEVKFENRDRPKYDDYTSIAKFYGLDKNKCNRYKYNPFTEELTLDKRNTDENKLEVLFFVNGIKWEDYCGNIEGFKKFLVEAKNIPFMQNNLNFDLSNYKVFDTRDAARHYVMEEAPHCVTIDAAWGSTYSAIFGKVGDTTRYPVNNLAWDVTYEAVEALSPYGVNDVSLYGVINYTFKDFPIAQKYRERIKECYNIWLNGYGVYCDMDDVFYVYRSL